MCNAEASDDGLFCGVKDLDGSLVGLVEHYWNTLCESVPKGKKPLMFVLTGDATGGWRGSSITHGEIGIGSFAKGKAISKLAYLPVWLMEGDDSTDNLRARAALVFEQYNKLKRRGTMTVTIEGKEITLKTKLLISADFQFFKAISNMSKYTSAIFCKCLPDDLFKYPEVEAKCWDDCVAFYASINGELKTRSDICRMSHYSLEVMLGKPFKQFGCSCGWTSGTEKQWRAAVEAHAQLDEKERKAANREHSSMPEHLRHLLFGAPLPVQDMIDNSVDVLHLIFINMFAFFMEHTMLIRVKEWEPAARAPFEAYLHKISIPMKIVKAQNVTEMRQSLTGRDSKVLTAAALKHIPALLEFVHTSEDDIKAAVE